jgi:hypothetical protein
MFASGTHDTVIGLVRDSAPVATGMAGQIDSAVVRHAVAALGDTTAALTVADDGAQVSATGSPLDVGYALGRLMTALAAEGLRATTPKATEDGAFVEVKTV